MEQIAPELVGRPVVLVADDDATYRQSLVQTLENLGFAAAAVEGDPRSVAALRDRCFATIIATVRMPSLRGAAMLQELARWRSATPVIAVGEPGTRSLVLQGLGGRPHAFLASPFERESLVSALERVLHQSPQEDDHAGNGIDIRALAASVRCGTAELPTIAPIASEVQRLLSDPEAGVTAVLDVVQKDPAIAAGILRLANSSRYRPPSPIKTLRTACMRLGNKRVLALAQEALLRDLFAVGAGPVQQVARALWQHTRVKAYGAREIAVLVGSNRPDEVQVAAMVCDLGELALLRLCADAEKDPSRWRDDSFLRELASGIHRHHESVGAIVLEKWHMDRHLLSVARYHHTRPRHPHRPPEERLRRLILAAWAGACEAGFGWLPSHDEVDVDAALRPLGLKPADLAECFRDAVRWVEDD